jgi:hypothetical protein
MTLTQFWRWHAWRPGKTTTFPAASRRRAERADAGSLISMGSPVYSHSSEIEVGQRLQMGVTSVPGLQWPDAVVYRTFGMARMSGPSVTHECIPVQPNNKIVEVST